MCEQNEDVIMCGHVRMYKNLKMYGDVIMFENGVRMCEYVRM